MKAAPAWLLAAVAIGFAAGFAARRAGTGGPAETQAAPANGLPWSERRPFSADGLAAAPGISWNPKHQRSADTVEDLELLEDGPLYGRLALWLQDAEVADIARFWESYRQREATDSWTIDLIFSRWTRLDPRGAIAAVKGTDQEGIAWWAWGMNSPEKALAAVKAEAPRYGSYVLRSVGQFHGGEAGKWRELYPEFVDWRSIEGLSEGLARQDPRAALDFALEHGQVDEDRLVSWLRDDPVAAIDWAMQNDRDQHGSQNPTRIVFNTLLREDPEMASNLIHGMPVGKTRHELEMELFRQTADEDPDAAEKAARQAPSDRIRVEQLMMVGKVLLRDDPDRAFGLLAEALDFCPDALNGVKLHFGPNGLQSSGAEDDSLRDLRSRLVEADPERLMDMVSGRFSEEQMREFGNEVFPRWAEAEPQGLAEWLNQAEAGEVRDQGVFQLSSYLSQLGSIQEAVDWVKSMDASTYRGSALSNVVQISNWSVEDWRELIAQDAFSESDRRAVENVLHWKERR
ncbi:hypothetical protein [Haloferula sargassicola]|uniref:Uncharacterized protein n=1 Tax=Haloferula sargassicola TaxID=490096 RepID=A0ABP9UI88_9BACT